MADVRLQIASREYIVTCRDGEETHLSSLAAMVNDMVQEAGGATGGLNESRQLLFAALLLADKLFDTQKATSNPEIGTSNASDFAIDQAATTIEKMAIRMEALAVTLEN